MPVYDVKTPQRTYSAIVERGILEKLASYIPTSASKVFIVSTKEVWTHHGGRITDAVAALDHSVLFFPGGEERKRLASVEALAEQMMQRGGDRSSIVIAFGGGIVTDVAGFLAAVFMRGVPVLQIPTTLLAQVDASIGGKTGVNLAAGKNLMGSFHQPLAVLIDPEVLGTLPPREYRAGLFEIVKCGVIRDRELFHLMSEQSKDVLARTAGVVDRMIAESVRIKAEVVSADERESGLRRILNFGHTVGHALEAETNYSRFLHGEAVAFGMRAATHLAVETGHLKPGVADDIFHTIANYGSIPSLAGISAESLAARLRSDKKTVHGTVHFVLPLEIGRVSIVAGIESQLVVKAIERSLT